MTEINFSRDGRWLAASFNPSGVSIFQASKWIEVASFALEKSVLNVEFSFDGKWFLVICRDQLFVYDTETWEIAFSPKINSPIKQATFASDVPVILMQTLTDFFIFEGGIWATVVHLSTQHDHVSTLLSPDDRLLLLHEGNILTVFRTQDWKMLWRNELGSTIHSLEFSLDNQFLILSTGSLVGDSTPPRSQEIHIISADFGFHERLTKTKRPINLLRISPDDTWVAMDTDVHITPTEETDARIVSRTRTIWNLQTGKMVARGLGKIKQLREYIRSKGYRWKDKPGQEGIVPDGNKQAIKILESTKSWATPRSAKALYITDKQWMSASAEQNWKSDGNRLQYKGKYSGSRKKICVLASKMNG